MAPKKKKIAKASGSSEKNRETDPERGVQLHREYDTLTETLRNLKRWAEKLRTDNEVLQIEINQIRMETQEYLSYKLKQTQKHEKMIATLSDQNQKKLDELSKQRERMMEKHKEQINSLKMMILDKQTELAQLNREIAEIEDVKRLQQQHLDRIAELEQEVITAHSRHSEALHVLKDKSFQEKKRYTAEAKDTVYELTLKARKEAPLCVHSYMQQVTEENHHMYMELQQLIQRVQALRSHLQRLQTQHIQLLLEKEHMQDMQRLHNTRGRQHMSNCFQLTDPGILATKPCLD